MKSHRAESDPGRARGLPVFAREVGHLHEAGGWGRRLAEGLTERDAGADKRGGARVPRMVMNLSILVFPFVCASSESCLSTVSSEGGLCCLGAAANAAAETPKSQEGNDFPHKGTSVPPQGEARRPPRARRSAPRLVFVSRGG